MLWVYGHYKYFNYFKCGDRLWNHTKCAPNVVRCSAIYHRCARTFKCIIIFPEYITTFKEHFKNHRKWRKAHLISKIFKKLNISHPLELVDRASEPQLQVGEKFNYITLRVTG